MLSTSAEDPNENIFTAVDCLNNKLVSAKICAAGRKPKLEDIPSHPGIIAVKDFCQIDSLNILIIDHIPSNLMTWMQAHDGAGGADISLDSVADFAQSLLQVLLLDTS